MTDTTYTEAEAISRPAAPTKTTVTTAFDPDIDLGSVEQPLQHAANPSTGQLVTLSAAVHGLIVALGTALAGKKHPFPVDTVAAN